MAQNTSVKKYLSNPVEVSAIQRDGTVERDQEIVDFLQENEGDFIHRPAYGEFRADFRILTDHGEVVLPVGWYLIKESGADGKFSVCSKDVFKVKFKGLRRA